MELIEKIYNGTIKHFMKKMPNDEKIKEYYKNYLIQVYSSLNINDSNIKKVVELEIMKWKDVSADSKKRLIIPDENLDKLFNISSFAYNAALNRLKKGELLKDVNLNDYYKSMDMYRSKVYDFNANLADYYISESSVDLEYAVGNTEYMSLRIAREVGTDRVKI